ncbi:hypothetical protein [Planktothrix agardhii]|uniref:hypothetical protein n=1 Tax=Planktothrix agardhii TaxID=1160 RepID=UPI0004888CA3|nr:hypothetical protein [Planktothrix agardhii]
MVRFFLIIFLSCICFLGFDFSQNLQVDAQQSFDLNGEWIMRGDTATGDNRGCTLGGSCSANGSSCSEYKVNISHQGNSISYSTAVSSSGGGHVSSVRGTVSGNSINFVGTGGGFTGESQGTISNDGNTITGKGVCSHSGGPAKATITFTLTRKEEILYQTL